jgi:KDO2-lipid IV(A) lauroyltransferase
MVAAFRRAPGQRVISKFRALPGVLRALKRGEIAALLMDQDAGRQGIFVEFFGRSCSTSDAVGRLAVRTGAPVVVSITQRVGPGQRHRFTARRVDFEPAGDARADAAEVTRRATAVLEEMIRARPEQWLWIHRRWKTRPRPAPADEAGDPGT